MWSAPLKLFLSFLLLPLSVVQSADITGTSKQKFKTGWAGIIKEPEKRFISKHLFKDGTLPKEDSFRFLSENPERAKMYLVEMNLKLYQGKILPQAKVDVDNKVDRFSQWFSKMDENLLTIVDADFKDITNSAHKSQEWKAYNPAKNDKIPDLTTPDAFTVTHITYELDGYVVKVIAEQSTATLTLGVTQKGLPKHLQGIKFSQTTPAKKQEICSFSLDELHWNGELTQKFYKALQVGSGAQHKALNPNHEDFVTKWNEFKTRYENNVVNSKRAVTRDTAGQIVEIDAGKFREQFELANPTDKDILLVTAVSNRDKVVAPAGREKQFIDHFIDDLNTFRETDAWPTRPGGCRAAGARRRRRAASRCAIFLRKDGAVDSINPDEFQKIYDDVDDVGKRKMTELIENDLDKVGTKAGEKKLQNLVDLEKVKAHTSTVNQIQDIQSNPKNSKLTSAKLNAVEKVYRKAGKVKVSATRIASKLSNSKFTKSVGKASKPIGGFLLAKGIVNGIVKNDTTSLAIIGGMTGWELGTTAATKGLKNVAKSAKIAKVATAAGKGAKLLGKIAGPIGAAADIGISIYSLANSVERLSNSTNKYDKNDAIADIIATSVDIAITVGVTAVSIAFPPAAPIAAAVGFVSSMVVNLVAGVYKSFNEVDRVNAELPLLDFEKSDIFWSSMFEWIGVKREAYIDDLLKEKSANDMAVQMGVDFLEGNDEYLGIVVPSRTLRYEDNCKLTREDCISGVAGFVHSILGLRCSGKKEWGEYCEQDGRCSNGEICINREEEGDETFGIQEDKTYYTYNCSCTGAPNVSFGFPKRHQLIDFRAKQEVYWDRTVPKDVENARFMCKPGSSTNQGHFISQWDPILEYLCDNAIGILWPRSEANRTTMMFDLEDGDDTVYCGDKLETAKTRFRMGNRGTKKFYGGSSTAQFLFDGNCTEELGGRLEGGSYSKDAILLHETCANGERIEVDFKDGKMRSGNRKLNLELAHIEEIIGRKGQSEKVVVGCSTRQVITQGGSTDKADEVIIPYANCDYNASVMVDPETDIISEAESGRVNLYLTEPWNGATMDLEIFSGLSVTFTYSASSGVSLVSEYADYDSRSFILASTSDRDSQISFVVRSSSAEEHTLLYFTEDFGKTPGSGLMASVGSPLKFYHSLPSTSKSRQRFGCKNIPNRFEVGSGWSATGGDLSDEFILKSTSHNTLDGGRDLDILIMDDSIPSGFTLDLSNPTKFRSVEEIYGITGTPLNVISSCETTLVVGKGGTKSDPDVVKVPPVRCNRIDTLLIEAAGESRVAIEGDVLYPTIVLSLLSPDTGIEIEAKSGNVPSLIVIVKAHDIQLQIKRSDYNHGKVHLQLEGEDGESVQLKLADDFLEERRMPGYIYHPFIQMEQKSDEEFPGQLIFERESKTAKVLYHLNSESRNGQIKSSIIVGHTHIQNVFHITPVHHAKWNVRGGDKNDHFIIFAGEGTVHVDGNVGQNILTLEASSSDGPDEEDYFTVFPGGNILNGGGNMKQVVVQNVQHVLGRQNAPDHIGVDCGMETVNGRGGNGIGREDMITFFSTNCSHSSEVKVVAEKFTKVRNENKEGSYKYSVKGNWETVDFALKAGGGNNHFIVFEFNPWEEIASVEFNETRRELGFLLKGNAEKAFKLYGENEGEEYSNPKLRFQAPGGNVVSEVRVSGSGVTSTTFLVSGDGSPDPVIGIPVDLNRFLVNITKTKRRPSGVIRGSPIKSSNQFWLFNLATPLKVLDGGSCSENPNCLNYLQLGISFKPLVRLEVDLNWETGSLTGIGEKKPAIAKLQNIHEFYGREKDYVRDVVHVYCTTKTVGRMETIIVQYDQKDQAQCKFNMLIKVGANTEVLFDIEDPTNESIEFYNSTIQYDFPHPVSFDPLPVDGSENYLGYFRHIYRFPFKLESLEYLRFDMDEEKLVYKLDGKEYSHSMLSDLEDDDQFYRQPEMITKDGYRIQVGRDGDILTSKGPMPEHGKSRVKRDVEEANESVTQEVIHRLGITLMEETKDAFIYSTHDGKGATGERNVLQTLSYKKTRLNGGGATDTIYMITALDEDVQIDPGFTRDQLLQKDFGKEKQTIDLADIVFQIRAESGVKYVPKVVERNDDLVLVMEGYEANYPGSVVIGNGSRENVANGFQLLLHNALMDLARIGEGNQSEWKIKPRPLVIPRGSIYSLAAEDLEDGQEILLEEEDGDTPNNGPSFQPMKSGTSLFLTDVGQKHNSSERMGELTTILIYDAFTGSSDNETEGGDEDDGALFNMPKLITNVSINLPGLSLQLDDSNVWMNEGGNGTFQVLSASDTKEWSTIVDLIEEDLYEEAFQPENIFAFYIRCRCEGNTLGEKELATCRWIDRAFKTEEELWERVGNVCKANNMVFTSM